MNRRSFFGKVAAVAAVPAIAEVVAQVDAAPLLLLPSETRLLAAPPGTSTTISVTSPRVETVTPFWADRLTLLRLRGLLVPCPNCATIDWVPTGYSTCDDLADCRCCGWHAPLERIMLPCRCRECRRPISWTDATDATRAHIDLDAEPGLYRVVEGGSGQIRIPVRQYRRNVYSVYEDTYLHNAVEHQLARVRCAVRLFTRDRKDRNPAGADANYRQPGGNQVLLAWEMVDCYEWQQQRGERPALVQEMDAHGYTWTRYPTERL